MTDDLVAFLRARLDEDAAAAREADPGPWEVRGTCGEVYRVHTVGTLVDSVGGCHGHSEVFVSQVPNKPNHRQNAAHVARHDPTRVLAEVAAKKAIIDTHRRQADRWCVTCDVPGDYQGPPHGCTTLRLLTAVYADHPDYREEWKP
jgi:hypothetical protein